MRKRGIRVIIAVLGTYIAVVVGLELLLRAFDPWGMRNAYNDLVILHQNFQVHPERGYSLPEGTLHFANWSATINADQTRLVPAANPESTCTIAMIGDSLTFGQGVDDAETFTNLLAVAYPAVRFINAGINGYNISNALATIHDLEADAYIYVMLENDADPPLHIEKQAEIKSAIVLYWRLLPLLWEDSQNKIRATSPSETGLTYPDWVVADAQATAAVANVQIVGFDSPLPQYLQSLGISITIIPGHGHRISRADPHPNAEGHKALAAGLSPYVARWIAEYCESTQ